MLAGEMRRLAEEIANAYEERIEGIARLKQKTLEQGQKTAELLGGFGEARAEMAREMRSGLMQFKADLENFKADLDAAESDRKKTMQAELKEMADQLRSDLDKFMSDLARFQSDLKKAANDRKNRMQAELKEMADQLRSDLGEFKSNLGGFKSDLEEAESERKKRTRADLKETAERMRSDLDKFMSDLAGFQSDLKKAANDRKKKTREELKEMADELRGKLEAFRTDLSEEVGALMAELKAGRSEAMQAWNQILSTMRHEKKRAAAPSPPAKVKAIAEVKPVEEAIEEEAIKEEAIEEEEFGEREELRENILDLLDETPDGLRMVEIADHLGISNWRSLIPVMRELLDEGEVRKEDSTYYVG